MSLGELLDTRRIALLRQRLLARVHDVSPRGLLSVTLDLGAGDDRWLNVDLANPWVLWWATPRVAESAGVEREYCLALGSAMWFSSAGSARFRALQAAFTGLGAIWVHDDPDHTGVEAAAHIGFAFAEETLDTLANARLVVPAVLLRSRRGRRLVTFSCPAQAAEGALTSWFEALRGADRRLPASGLTRRWVPQPSIVGEQAFISRARAALVDIERGLLEKMVITRSLRLRSESPVSAASVLAELAEANPDCTIFGVGEQGQSFVGATPERLVSLRQATVTADALAGTAWVGGDTGSPASLDLSDSKNRREHQLVANDVRAALAAVGVALDPQPAPTIRQLGSIRHLQTTIGGRLPGGGGFFDLLSAVHPTPAVGGLPRDRARHWLLAHGDRRPAWYTGGIGWIDRSGDGDVFVALRCARLRGCEAELFAGAGLVAGSEPLQELAETEAKLTVVTAALLGTTAASGYRSPRSASA